MHTKCIWSCPYVTKRRSGAQPICVLLHCSPFAYALRAVVVNEMTSPSWAAPRNPGVPSSKTIGQASLESFGFFTDR